MVKTIYDPAYRSLIAELKVARIKRKLRQEDVARALRVSRHWVSKIEAATCRLDVVQFTQLCRVYHIKPCRLIRRLEKESSSPEGPFYVLDNFKKGKTVGQYVPFSLFFSRTVDWCLAIMRSSRISWDLYSRFTVVFCPHFALLSAFEHPLIYDISR